MRRLIAVILGVAIGAVGMYAAFNYHLVRSEKTWVVVPKQRADWHDAYADIRGWTNKEWSAHKDLSHNLVAIGRGDLVHRSITDQLFRGLFDSFRESPPPARGPSSPSP